MKKVSVIVPVYNVEKYLEECLQSLVVQTIKDDIEVIIINDGSTDNSQAIIEKYVDKYPKLFRAFKKENEGLGMARNYVMKYTTGEYITFLDSDDYVISDAYEQAYNKAKEEDLDIVFFDLKWFYPDGKTESRSTIPDFVKNDDICVQYLFSNSAACNKLIKRDVWGDTKFPGNIWYEDLAIIPSFANKTKKIGYLDKEIYMYRQRDNSIMSKNVYNPKLLDIIKSCQFIYDELYDTMYKDELEYLYIFQLIYYASFRFIVFDKYEDIELCCKQLKQKFPNWKNNKYYKRKPILFRIYCSLLEKKSYGIVKILIKLRGGN